MRMLNRLKGLLKRRKFLLFTRPFELNIVGLRNKSMKAIDEIHVFYKTSSRNWNYHIYDAITDTAYLWKDKVPVLLKEGQYKDAYGIGEYIYPHGDRKTDALIEVKPVSIIRDYERNTFLPKGKVKSELFGIDIIPPSFKGKQPTIAEKDEGSQVFTSEENFSEFMQLCEKHSELYGNQFTYTLIDFRSARKKLIRRGLELAASLLGSLAIGFLVEKIKGKKKRKK